MFCARRSKAAAQSTRLISLGVFLSLFLACSPSGDADYMNAALRERVENLKKEAAASATTVENVDERTATLWAWANAFSLRGGVLPVPLPNMVGAVARARFDGTPPPKGIMRNVDRYIEELRVKDENPDALGELRIVSELPVVAESWATVEQSYTAGSLPLAPGAVITLGRQILADQGDFQHEDPAADNYISIRASNPDVSFEPTRVPLSGWHGGFRGGPKPTVSFVVAGGALAAGETFTVTYGDKSEGSPGFKVQTYASEELLLPIYLDFEGKGNFFSLRWPGLRVVGLPEVRSVNVFVPSIVGVGETFELAVRSNDRFFNRPSTKIPGYRVTLNGKPWREIPESDDAVTVIDDVVLAEPGVYRFSLSSSDGAVTGTSNPVWVRRDPNWRVFWGETHSHTALAEGQGTPDGLYRFAREDARLDFATLSEHDGMMDDFEWQTLSELARSFNDEGRFIVFLGYEWSTQTRQGGHHNVLFRTPDRKRVPMQSANDLPLLYEGLRAENSSSDVLVIPHAHQAGDWNRSDPDLEKLVEISSMHGTFEWFGNLYLKNGFEIGFIAASDDHRGRPGYQNAARMQVMTPPILSQKGGLAAAIAPQKTGEAIFDALRDLSAYATSGERIILDAELNGFRMGTRQENSTERRVTCKAMGTAPIDQIGLIKNGEVIFNRDYMSAPLRSRSWIQVGFQSSSEVFPPARDNPRAYRVWKGTVEVSGARLLSVETPGFENQHYTERATVDSNNSNLVRFHVETRGRRDTMLLELDGASASTTFRFQLGPSTEHGSTSVLARALADIPGEDFKLRLAHLENRRLEKDFQVDQHTDRLTLQVVDPNAPFDQEFEFTDLENLSEGDYYYVRVRQGDGALAWSSPFWVGKKAN